jgi:hypothetical protein
MAHGVPKNAARMNDLLTLEFDVLDDRPDWPVVGIRVNGRNPFEKVAKEWRGFDPAEILGARSPLVPDDAGRRVAVYRCSCGEAGCGVIAPYIVASPHHTRISWVDFRDYTGVFNGPLAPRSDDYEGRPWDLPDLHFDRDQYLAEVRRATKDRSWETPRRHTARLLKEHLRSVRDLTWVSPAWNEEGMALSFEQAGHHQLVLRLTSTAQDPAQAAADMAQQLRSAPPEDWPTRFRYGAR